MPRSPRRRIPFVTVASRIDDASQARLGCFTSAKLDCSNDSQDHTVLPYADIRWFATGFDARVHATIEILARLIFSAVRLAESRCAHGLRLNPPPAPLMACRADAAASTASPARIRDDVRSPLSSDRDAA